MSSPDIHKYIIDASVGAMVKVGEKVNHDTLVGYDLAGNKIISGIIGTVKGLKFDGESHAFMVLIEEERPADI